MKVNTMYVVDPHFHSWEPTDLAEELLIFR